MISLCHQLPQRSFLWLWDPPLLCARCTGFYLAMVVALLLFLWRPRWSRAWSARVLAAGIAGVLAITLEKTLHLEIGNWGRFFTALPMGFAVGLGLAMPFVSRPAQEEIQ